MEERQNKIYLIMVLFKKQIEFVDNFETLLFEKFREGVQSYGLVLKNYIVEKQLYDKGIDGTGKRLEGYTRTTIRYKLQKGQPADRTTLKDEGEFHASIEIKAFSDHFEVSSNVTHDKFIIKHYGRNVLKITNDNLKEFIEKFVLPKLKER